MHTNCLSTQSTNLFKWHRTQFQLSCQRNPNKNTHNCKLSRNPHKDAHKLIWVHNELIYSNDIALIFNYHAKETLTRIHTIVSSQGTLTRMHTNCLSTQSTNLFKWHRTQFQLSCQRNPNKNTHNCKLSRNPHKDAHKLIWVHNELIYSNDIALIFNYHAKGTLTRIHTIVSSQGTLTRMHTNEYTTL